MREWSVWHVRASYGKLASVYSHFLGVSLRHEAAFAALCIVVKV